MLLLVELILKQRFSTFLKNEISLLRLNGRSQSDFTFNTKTKVLTAALNLKDGRNEISVHAVNSAGSDEDSETKNCDGNTPPPSTKPQVTINSPSDNSTTSKWYS